MNPDNLPTKKPTIWQWWSRRQLGWRIPLLTQTLRNRFEFWQMARELDGTRKEIERGRYRAEEAWQKWERAKAGREKESIRKSLSKIDRWLDSKEARIDALLEIVNQKRAVFRTVGRWLWQGHVDDHDGPPERILNRRDPDLTPHLRSEYRYIALRK